MNVVAYLNAIIQNEPRTEPSPNECRRALWSIETQDLAVQAIRQFTIHPKSVEALAHATRFITLHDSQLAARAHAEALVAAPPIVGADLASAQPEQNQDFTDLV